MAKRLRLFLLGGPGAPEQIRAAIVSRQWSILLNCSQHEAARSWPSLESEWHRRRTDSFILAPFFGDSRSIEQASAGERNISGADWSAVVLGDERRPGRQSLMLEAEGITVGFMPGSQQDEPAGSERILILDASWTHIGSFPEREDAGEAILEALALAKGKVYYVTNLPWDAAFFRQTAAGAGRSQVETVLLDGLGERMLCQARQILPRIERSDSVLIALVPGRDERGAFQRLRSDFAQRAGQVRAYPAWPISTGPGPSREEALAAVGLWLPTHVLIAGGPISEQFLLARHLEENTGSSRAVVGVLGGEYRLPSLELTRRVDGGRSAASHGAQRLRSARAGLVVATFNRDGDLELTGAGLPETVSEVLPKVRVDRRGKTPEQVVREVEAAFGSRGLPVPSVRYLP